MHSTGVLDWLLSQAVRATPVIDRPTTECAGQCSPPVGAALKFHHQSPSCAGLTRCAAGTQAAGSGEVAGHQSRTRAKPHTMLTSRSFASHNIATVSEIVPLLSGRGRCAGIVLRAGKGGVGDGKDRAVGTVAVTLGDMRNES